MDLTVFELKTIKSLVKMTKTPQECPLCLKQSTMSDTQLYFPAETGSIKMESNLRITQEQFAAIFRFREAG